MIIFLAAVTILYVLFIGALVFGWKKIPEDEWQGKPVETGFSVVIPYRNEAANLAALLDSLNKLNYPENLFEIQLVNDASEDDSLSICAAYKEEHPELNLQLMQNQRSSNSPKKDAITTAVKEAGFEYILTTDADCILPENWLQVYNQKILETGADLIAGPVAFKGPAVKSGKQYFQNFQEMDFLSLQASGAGGFGLEKAFMCNGANLCYKKEAFFQVEGFAGNNSISSGDDVFLLQKFADNNFRLEYLKSKEAIVFTQPQPNITSLLSQRIRWAAKASAYKSHFAKLLGISVFLMNFSLITGGMLALFNVIPYQPILIMFLLKFNLDFILIYQAAKFFNREEVLRSYFWCSIVYPFISAYIAILSLFIGFEWKGRKFKK